MKHYLSLSLLLFLTLPTACTRHEPTKTERMREKPTLSDSDLKNSVQAKFNSDPQLRAANLTVAADASRNTVTLSGTVGSEAIRTKALRLAKDAHPGVTINDSIQVKPTEVSRSTYTTEQAQKEKERARAHNETIGSGIDDAWIHTKIVAKLVTDRDTPEHKINVDVNNNVVTLRGTVDNAKQKAEAERIAMDTDGVKQVNNQLQVKTGSAPKAY
jgi:hyperosmotically inducible periplasmic protein